MAFLVFALLFCLLFYAHFALAHRAWRVIRGRESGELDMSYVRVEDYFGQSFRSKLEQWLKALPPASGSTQNLQIFNKGNERIFVAGSVQYPSGRKESEILVIRGDFSCGRDCQFERELMVNGDCAIGDDAQMQAVAVDGSLHIGSGARVRRWVDAARHLTLGPDSSVGSRVTSRTSIEILPGAQAPSLFAPEIYTEGRMEIEVPIGAGRSNVIQIPHRANQTSPEGGYDPRKLFSMGADTYLYDGDLHLSEPVHVRGSLVVRGDFWCPSESLIGHDVKAHGSITIGAASMVKGNLFAGKDLLLKQNTYFQGLLQAGGTMRLSRGVRGLRYQLPVAAYATGILTVESNVVVHGKLASGQRVLAMSTPLAWLETTSGVEA